MYDIAIIGLGPAGATLARLLDSRFRVIAIDKKSSGEAASFEKPCGGLLAGDAQKALSKFNLVLPKSVLVDPQIFAVKTIDTKQGLLRHYQRFYINLDRSKFDRWLISLIPARVRVEEQAVCLSVQPCAAGYRICFLGKQGEETVTARYVVGADGSNSVVRRALFPKRDIRRYLSLQQWFSEQNTTPVYSCIFDADVTDCYCWTISKDGYFIVGGAFPREKARERFALLKQKLRQQGYLFGEPVKTEGCLVSMPRPGSICTGGNDAFLIGEAAGFISPSSLEGISYALDSAHLLAGVLNGQASHPNRAYWRKTLPVRLKLLLKTLKSPFLYHPLLRRLVMQSGLCAISVVDAKQSEG